ncbi:hypothetical protein A8B82_21235 [Sulfitobacter sp. EhC04]|uniref:hypothetical protein n=1 Tax=Sulfitobacter sp. EhC04 TaxID=1849168 RepID=UPI0007F3D02D|nr:hypothetical protein [Sulfitobacter sp. EhC04]OAN71119.1 hypothetical protein A8B82_21235 [Sulfitobacter sp. EhC04]
MTHLTSLLGAEWFDHILHRQEQDTAQCRAAGAGDGPRLSHPEPRRPHYQEISDLLFEDQMRREMRADDDLRRRVQFDQET